MFSRGLRDSPKLANNECLTLATANKTLRCINNYDAFWCVVNFELRGKLFREENSIDVYGNIRFLAALVVNVGMLMSYQTFQQGWGADTVSESR